MFAPLSIKPQSVAFLSFLIFFFLVKTVRRQYQGMDRPGVRLVPEGSGEERKMEETGREFICGIPTTLVVKG